MKTIRTIEINADNCTGCRSCELNCSAYHAEPRYSLVNPKRSRIRVFWDEDNNLFVPILAGQYTDAECNGRNILIINGKKYGECSFCRSSCPSRDLFKEPDADIPIKCDMCGEPPPPDGPSGVRGCFFDALSYVEREVEE